MLLYIPAELEKHRLGTSDVSGDRLTYWSSAPEVITAIAPACDSPKMPLCLAP